MPEPLPTYRRLPGRGTSAVSYTTLYLAADHLLQVASTGFNESYKRFYFTDIQSISVQRTSTGRIWNLLLSIPTVPSLIFAGDYFTRNGSGDQAVAVAWSVAAAIFGIPLLINLALGPTCVCHLRTAVQNERLASVGRFRRAQKILGQLRQSISAAQGQLSAEELARQMDEPFPSQSEAASAAQTPEAGSSTPETP